MRLVGTLGKSEIPNPKSEERQSVLPSDFGFGISDFPSRRAYFGADHGSIDTPVVTRADIDDGARGPLLIDEYDSTTVVPPGWSVRRDDEGNLVLEPEG